MSILQHLNDLQQGKRRTQTPYTTASTPISQTVQPVQVAPANGSGGGEGAMAKPGGAPPAPGTSIGVISQFSANQVTPSSAQVPKSAQSSPAVQAYMNAMANRATSGFNTAVQSADALSGKVSQNLASPNSAQVQNSVQPSLQQQAIEPPTRVQTYEEMFKRMNPEKPKTPAEIAAEKKKRKRESLFAAIADGLSSISNLYFTSKYAPSQNAPKMAEGLKARYDKIDAERKTMEKEYREGLMRARKWDDDLSYSDRQEKRAERDWREKFEDALYARKRRKIEDQHKDELHTLQLELQKGNLTLQEYQIKQAELNNKYAEQEKKLGISKANAEIASANAHAEYYKNGGKNKDVNGKSKYMVLQDKEGKKYYVPNDEWPGIAQKMFAVMQKEIMSKGILNGGSIADESMIKDFQAKTKSVQGQEAWVKGHWHEYQDFIKQLEGYGYGNPDKAFEWDDPNNDEEDENVFIKKS